MIDDWELPRMNVFGALWTCGLTSYMHLKYGATLVPSLRNSQHSLFAVGPTQEYLDTCA